MTSDGDRLAPVTWLFGSPAEQPVTETAESPSVVDSPASPLPAVPIAPASPPPAVNDAAPAQSQGTDEKGRFQRVNNVSMHALARRGMSVDEMSEYLTRRGFDSDEIALECERLVGVGLLDDFALAETLIRTLRQRKGLGRSALVGELRRRKLDSEAIDAALEDLDDDELARAVELAEKRAPQLRSLDSQTAKRRLSGFLMRKGYSGSIVQVAVDRALAPAGSGPVFR